METTLEQTARNRNKGIIKALALGVFIIAAIYLIRFTPVKGYLTAEGLGHFLEKTGIWAPVLERPE